MKQSELIKLIRKINLLITSGVFNDDFQELDNKLDNLNVDHEEPVVLVSYLRSTSSIKRKLTKWDDLLSRTRISFKKRGIDNVLRGLKHNEPK